MKRYIKINILGRSGYFIDTLGFDYNICYNVLAHYNKNITEVLSSEYNLNIPTYKFYKHISALCFQYNNHELFKYFDYSNFEILLNMWNATDRNNEFAHYRHALRNDLRLNYKKYIDEAIIKDIIE